MSAYDDAFDASHVLVDDALLDLLAAGGTCDEDAVAVLLSEWRAELSRATPAPLPRRAPTPTRRDPGRASHTAMSAVAAAALLMTGGVAAAAASGPGGPLGALHRVLFGEQHTPTITDATATRVSALLEQSERRLTAARAAGSLSARERAAVSATLDAATRLLDSDPAAPTALWQRLHALRRELAQLPIADPASTVVPAPTSPGPAPVSWSPSKPAEPNRAPATSSTPSAPPSPNHDRSGEPGAGSSSANPADGGGDGGDRSTSPSPSATSDTSDNANSGDTSGGQDGGQSDGDTSGGQG